MNVSKYRRRPQFLKRKCPLCNTRYVLATGILLGLVGASLLVAFGFMYLEPYLKTKDFKRGKCTVTSSSVIRIVKCRCTPDGDATCTSSYPCLLVNVTYTLPNETVIYNATIFDSYDTWTLHASRQTKCSFHYCDRIVKRNVEEMELFGNTYGHPGESFYCYYDTDFLQYPILERVSPGIVINAMVWSLVALLLGCILMTYIMCRKQSPKSTADDLQLPDRATYAPTKQYYENMLKSPRTREPKGSLGIEERL